MHYIIDYSWLDSQAKHDKAIADIREYMGNAKYEQVKAEFQRQPSPIAFERFQFYLSIAGIQGYPVKAMYQECWPHAEVSSDV